ncbi:PilC/PilY family type IV pilus protein [Geopsychrobacter electrodiphilus]|uniref:PilC/PilY family type IV pilus protein n=1 Tax=Geopsychrobacter electrodiphilus TaxID=225196 RepID=UPI00036DC155|nr:PilC/PilY family type IV pilus protein [Geopsychrobacter electrodiphilus]
MKKRTEILRLLSISVLLCLLSVTQSFAGICSIINAGTLIEAEHFTSFGDNFKTKTNGSASNSSFLEAISSSDYSNPPSGTPVSFQVDFPAGTYPQTYRLVVRGDGRHSGSKDSIWYGVDGTATGNLNFNSSNGWKWSSTRQNYGSNPADIVITSAGTHTLNFWTREKGFYFDSFVLTTDLTVTSYSDSVKVPPGVTAVDPTDPGNNSCGSVVVDPDTDGDGYTDSNDCAPLNPAIHPGAAECLITGLGDGIDNNCNTVVDEGCLTDNDGDGVTSSLDCNDNDPAIYPGHLELCHDGKDNDCDGFVDMADPDCDVDGDGYTTDQGDCRDDRADIHPGAVEICGDLIDNDCNGTVDDGCDTTAITDSGLISQIPLTLKNPAKPQVMLDMSNDQQLYFAAYSEYGDLNQDGIPDGTYIHAIDYFGYFDAHKCYVYDTGAGYFSPVSITADKYCAGGSSKEWSGNFLNWASTARIDAVRKILYGGNRSTDTSALTVLERSYLPNDAHSWVKYYSGTDIAKLTPFAVGSLPKTATSTSSVAIGGGSKTFTTTFLPAEVRVGDQLIISKTIDPSQFYMRGAVTKISGSDVQVDVSDFAGSGTNAAWTLSNQTRKGITLCNTTLATSGYSQDVTAAPLIRVANGDYSLWTANERWQCRWDGEKSVDNGNDIGLTGITANKKTPVRGDVALSVSGLSVAGDYAARVKVCDSTLLGNEKCRQYPSGDYKPVGLLQVHGENDNLEFGLMTGSYKKNKSGGVLRKNISSISDEINVTTDGTFTAAPSAGSIIATLNKLRLYGYNQSTGTYNDSGSGDNCSWGLSSFTDGNCSNWGNPQSEIFLESLRYFAGKTANSAFTFSGDDKLAGLTTATWSDPLSDKNYCSSLNIIDFNASMASYDSDQLSSVSDLNTTLSAAEMTDTVGAGESINGNTWLVGESGTNNNQLCTAKTVASLGDVQGICPEAPRLSGSYAIAGLAHQAFTHDIRAALQGEQTVKTFGVSLAAAVPQIDIPVPGYPAKSISIMPACRNTSLSPNANCNIVSFKPIYFNKTTGSGKFFIQWEDSEQGGDYDQDMSGFLGYKIDSSTLKIEVTTDVFSQSTGNRLGFGYIISGTRYVDGTTSSGEGFHVHSGINGFSYVDGSGAQDCSAGCNSAEDATSQTYTISGTPSGRLESPLYYAAKWGGYNKKNTSLTFPTDTASWDADGDGQPDNYFYATNPSQLEASLGKVFTDLAEVNSSSAAVASNSTQLQTGTTIYQAKFNSADWSGEFLGIGLTKSTSGAVVTNQIWNAENHFPTPANRNIFTFNPSATSAPYGSLFTWATLTTGQQLLLNTSIAGANDGMGAQRVAFFRGDRTVERQNGGTLRDRNKVLGDIINSDPVYVGTPDYGYAKLPGTEGTSYTSFRAGSSYGTRTRMVYVGSNDGMLHAFNAETGAETFAYVPNSVINLMPRLTATNYGTQQNGHHFMVDGAPKPGDAYFGGAWHTVLLGSTGAGGRTVFALDVTDPGSYSTSNVMWEITPQTRDASSNFVYADLGYTIPQPTIGRLSSGEWVAFISNGYHSTNGKAVLYVVDLATGLPLATAYGTIDVGVGDSLTPNGLSTPVPVDENGDKIVDYVYAGDLLGNLWKFDFTDALPSKWGVAYKTGGTTPAPLFTAKGPNGEVQPITVRPAVGRLPSTNQIMIWFGTGKFFDSNDNVIDPVVANRPVQTFYGILDEGSAQTYTSRSTILQPQTILFEGKVPIPSSSPTAYYFDGRAIRVLSQNSVYYGSGTGHKSGWYLDLTSPNTPTKRGERVVEQAILDNGKIIFVTLIPSDSPCVSGGSSWLLEMDPFSGGRLPAPIYDANNDNNIDNGDKVTVNIGGTDIQVPVTGLESSEGIIQSPKVLNDDSAANSDGTGTQVKVFSGSTGNLMFQKEKGGSLSSKGRQSWRQIK